MADGSSPGPSTSLKRRPSYRALGDPSATPAAGGAVVWFFCAPAEREESIVVDDPSGGRHFLNACSLCKLPLRHNKDIYMCRGNVPFCSEECRQEWMEGDETWEEEERPYYRSVSAKAAAAAAAAASAPKRQQEGQKSASRRFHVRAAEAVAAG